MTNTHPRLACNPAETMPKLIDSETFPQELVNSSSVSIFLFGSKGMIYDQYRNDLVFPATSKVAEDDDLRYGYVNNETLPGILGCIDNTYICDLELDTCWNYPAKPMLVDGVNGYDYGWSWQNIDGPSNTTSETQPINLPIRVHEYEFPSIHNRTSGHTDFTRIWDRSTDFSTTEADLSLALLVHVLWGSNLCFMWQTWRTIEVASLCSNSLICKNLPLDQWKVEVRQLFETSLAQLQYAVLDTVRGRNVSSIEDYANIPPRLRGLCKMGKFKSVGWRNVSVWGLFGLLFFAAGVSLASVKTEEEELWLVVGFRLLGKVLRWIFDRVRKLPWRYFWTLIFDFVSLIQRYVQKVVAWILSKRHFISYFY